MREVVSGGEEGAHCCVHGGVGTNRDCDIGISGA